MSLLQDLGRYGHQRFGVLVGGAMDEWSHRLANALVGNDENDATLETVMTGPALRVDQTMLVAVCGADLSPTVTGRTGIEPLPHGRPVWIRAGARLDFGGARAGGLRAYLAVRGGFDVPPVLGSRSTYVRGGFGGLGGRALRTGDTLPVPPGAGPASGSPGPVAPSAAVFSRSVSGCVGLPPSPLVVPPVRIEGVPVIRIVAGQQWDVFTAESRQRFVSTDYRIGVQSDRMGYRLEGPLLERARTIEMISESVTFGTVQVPPDGLPIILMADRQTTGGYPKIANVASADLRVLAQMAPRQSLRFAVILLSDAQRILLAREREYSHVRQIMLLPPTQPTSRRNRR